MYEKKYFIRSIIGATKYQNLNILWCIEFCSVSNRYRIIFIKMKIYRNFKDRSIFFLKWYLANKKILTYIAHYILYIHIILYKWEFIISIWWYNLLVFQSKRSTKDLCDLSTSKKVIFFSAALYFPYKINFD